MSSFPRLLLPFLRPLIFKKFSSLKHLSINMMILFCPLFICFTFVILNLHFPTIKKLNLYKGSATKGLPRRALHALTLFTWHDLNPKCEGLQKFLLNLMFSTFPFSAEVRLSSTSLQMFQAFGSKPIFLLSTRKFLKFSQFLKKYLTFPRI